MIHVSESAHGISFRYIIPLSEGLNQGDLQPSQVLSKFYVAAVVAFSPRKDHPPRVNTFPCATATWTTLGKRMERLHISNKR